MKILLIVSAFNSLTQRVFCELKDMQHSVSVQFAINDKAMIDEVERFQPDIIFCPFLKKFIPPEIFLKTPTFVLHPGIRGDRGHNALDHALRDEKKEWGVVILRANEEFDGGDIYSEVRFEMRDTTKASLYRNEVADAASKALKELLKNFKDKEFKPVPQLKTKMHHYLTQDDRAINWTKDTSQTIIKKIRLSDSFPGVMDEFLGVECYMYGAWQEDKLKGNPKEIIAKRDGAICIGTVDGALWISHLQEVGKFKLPATYVLKDKIKGVKEERLPLIFDMSYKTFYEIGSHKDGDVAYLCFNFHNGAMGSEQCIRLKYAFEHLKESAKVIVLIGSEEFFSNGIHLNILEDSKKQGEDGWSNINAMNDLIKSVLFADEVITVASLHKNAGAGGVFLALASDYVVACENSVLNPHYKTLGLSGSEYHTYTLPKRVGEQKAQELLSHCLPINATQAKEIGMIDEVFAKKNYFENLRDFTKKLIKEEDIDAFRIAINKTASKLDPDDFIPKDTVMGILSSDDIDMELLNLLESFEPFGEANHRPRFLLQDAEVVSIKLMGADKSHSRIEVRQFPHERKTIELVAFRTVFEMPEDKKITCSYTVSKNEFNNRISVQLLLNKIY